MEGGYGVVMAQKKVRGDQKVKASSLRAVVATTTTAKIKSKSLLPHTHVAQLT